MPKTASVPAPMSALAARKAKAAAAAEAAAAMQHVSRRQASPAHFEHPIPSPTIKAFNAQAGSSVAASTRSRGSDRIETGRIASRSPPPQVLITTASGSDPGLVHAASDVMGIDAERPPARKRAKADRASKSGTSVAYRNTADSRPNKVRATSRYFLNGSRDSLRQDDVLPSIPIEDANTGFLAFGDVEEKDTLAPHSDEQLTEDDGMSSDEDTDQNASEASSTARTRENISRIESPVPPLSSRAESPISAPLLDSAQPAAPTIPYSKFAVKIDNNCLIHSKNAKQKHADAYTFGLRVGETLTFVGIGNVEVLKGKLQIGGAILSAKGSSSGVSSANVYAPIYHPLPVLKAIVGPVETLASSTFPDTFATSTFAAIVRVSPLESSIVDVSQVCAVGGTTPPFTTPHNLPLLKIPNVHTLKMLFEPDSASLTSQQQYFFANNIAISVGLSATYVPHAWQVALNNWATFVRSAATDSQVEASVALVRGPKKVGKSTFSKMALERTLTMGQEMGGKVAFLELDLGQSDFGPPGMVSLHVFDSEETFTIAPGWCQPRVPLRAHFIGDLSPKEDPSNYMEAIADLISFFRADVQLDPGTGSASKRVPLVVNTQGWVKGLGADLALRIESLLCPTNIYEVVPRGSIDPVPSPIRGSAWLDAEGAIVAPGPEVVTLESVNQTGFIPGVFNSKLIEHQPSFSDTPIGPGDGGPVPPPYITDAPPRLTPADVRVLNLMAYLYAQDLSTKADDVHWDFRRPLVHSRPLIVTIEKGLKAGVRILSLGSSVPDGFKLAALNASIVAIVAKTEAPQDSAVADTDELVRAKAIWKDAFRRGTDSLVPSSQTRCLGLGIVRSVDILRSEVHLLTPLSTALLSSFPALGLIKGALDLPIWASLDFDAIKDAKESKLDVAPSSFQSFPAGPQPSLAGVPRNQVPYVDWPWTPPVPPKFTFTSTPGKHSSLAKHATKNAKKNARQQQSTLATLGSQKRKVRRNLMRRGHFA